MHWFFPALVLNLTFAVVNCGGQSDLNGVESRVRESKSVSRKLTVEDIVKRLRTSPSDPRHLLRARSERNEKEWKEFLGRLDRSTPIIAWNGKERLAHALAENSNPDRKGGSKVFLFQLDQLKDRARIYFDRNPSVTSLRFIGSEIVIKTADGLDHLGFEVNQLAAYIVSAYEDRKGHLWFGTMSMGAIRFDGKSLTYFTKKDGLPSNAVPSFAEDAKGDLWIGTQEGVCRFDGQKIVQVREGAGLPAGGGSVSADEHGTIWVSVGKSLWRFDGKTFSEFEIPVVKKNISSFAIVAGNISYGLKDRKGNHWFHADGYGAIRFDGNTFTRLTKADGLCSNNITGILEDRQGNLWFSCMQSFQPEQTGDGGLCRFDGKKFTKFPHVKGLHRNDIYTIDVDRAGHIWIGATGHGLYRFDGRKFTLFEKTNRMDLTWSLGLQAALEDRNGTLWLGYSGGLFRFDGKEVVNVTRKDLANQSSVRRQEKGELLIAPDDWRKELIKFPLSFAPSIKFTGVEDIRFAPGWSRPKSSDFWTYKFVWQINEDPKLSEQRLARLVEAYFDGLARAGAKDLKTLQKPVAVFMRQENSFKGRIRIYDNFSTRKWMTLNARVQYKKSGNKHLVMFELSPQPMSHDIWTKLRKIKIRESAKKESAKGR